ncbi:MAG: PadR family transcriptional regulator [Acidobacteria bacterium]|nr:PadR family transcriptional regulator [Acidobacteriota bacterium]
MAISTILPGTLDLLILKAVSLGPQHGYGILSRIELTSQGHFEIGQGALYPALYRLETQGFLSADWQTTSNNRPAKIYTLTLSGQQRLEKELSSWRHIVDGMSHVLNAQIDPTEA